MWRHSDKSELCKWVALVKGTMSAAPEDLVIAEQGRNAAVLLQHYRVASPRGEEGHCQSSLPAGVIPPQCEGEVRPLAGIYITVNLLP